MNKELICDGMSCSREDGNCSQCSMKMKFFPCCVDETEGIVFLPVGMMQEVTQESIQWKKAYRFFHV